MFAGILHRYLMVIIACIALLAGLQAPSLVDQYQKRVDAHLREVTINLQPFQEIADRHFNGSMAQLIELHRMSDEKPFQEGAAALEQMIRRKARFEAELVALAVALPHRIAHVLFNSDKEILDETLAQYTYTVPLNQDALVTGGVFALVILLLMELLLVMARKGIRLLPGFR
ncbi:MAG: DUF2937 family protein [Zoogloeaceae bacterium]|jgi:Tfp pilus assembly protein PilE|nr:DUF2937 family protein [Zoogloeaceae bacterium]